MSVLLKNAGGGLLLVLVILGCSYIPLGRGLLLALLGTLPWLPA